MKALILRRRKLGRTSVKEIWKQMKGGIVRKRNDTKKKYPKDIDILFRWGCTSTVPYNGITIVNKAEAIHLASDKAECRRLFGDLSPKTWFSIYDDVTYPCIVRPKHHHQGRNLYVCNNLEELFNNSYLCGKGFYISEYIDKVEEYRVFVVQGRAVCVAKKTPANPEAVAWNVAQGGRFDNVKWDDWNLRVVRVAIEAFNLTGLDFGGVDVMVDKAGRAYVLEINSAPSLTSPYRQSCFAKAFDYILENGVKHFQNIKELPKGGYKKFIHPAIIEEVKE